MFRRIIALILKELQSNLRAPDTRRLLILPVILQLTLFPFASTLEVKHNTLAIYNQDIGQPSIELIQRLAKAKAFTQLDMLHSEKEVRDIMDNQRALLVIKIPSDFSRNILSHKTANIQALIDGRRSNSAQIVLSYIQLIVEGYQNDLIHMTQIPTSVLTVRNWFNPNLDYVWFILPCYIAIITTIGAVTVTALSVAREREQGTFEQLLVSPLTPGYIMVGKTIPALMIALMQASMIFFASMWLYGIPFQGSVVLMYVCLVFYGLSLAGIGLLISSVCNTQQQAFLGVFGFIMPSVFLSGFISPIENIPEPLRTLTWINPVRHFIVISKGIYLKGFGFAMVWDDLWPLLFIAVLSLGLAYFIFKRHLN